MRTEDSQLTDAQVIITRLLCPSWICEVSLRNGWPEIYFDHPKEGQPETCLWIAGDWWIQPAPILPDGLSDQHRQFIWLATLAGQEVRFATGQPDGGLVVGFASGLELTVGGVPSDLRVDEPWILSEPQHDDGAKVVALRNSGFATWPGR